MALKYFLINFQNEHMDISVKVGVVVEGDDGKVLLIKEKLQKKPVALWNIIKGTYEQGESIFDAARRECREEASVEVDLTHSLGAYVSEGPGKMRIQFNFLARASGMNAKVASSSEQVLRDESIEEVRWFAKEEITSMHPSEFVSARAHELLMDWVEGKKFPIEAFKQVEI